MGYRPLTQERLAGAGRFRPATRSFGRSQGLLAAGAAAAAAVLVPLYDRLSWTQPITADSANAVLQGRAMADGNVLLHGWTLSGASFYATDLPFYAAVAAVRGISPDVAHDVGALIYTLLVVAACFLARGRARGAAALARMAVAFVLLVAPAPGVAVQLLLLGPFHAGTTLVLVLALLALDAAGERPAGLLAFGALLTLAVVSDALSLYVGVLPVVLVSVLRLTRRYGRPAADAAVLTAALASLPASLVLVDLLHRLGGFATLPLHGSLAQASDLPNNAVLTLEGALVMFGVDLFGRPPSPQSVLSAVLHLAGLAFVLVAYGWALAAWRRGEQRDRVTQVLVVALAVDVSAYLFSNQAIDLMTSRYLIPFLAFGAVLAGRVGAERLGVGWRRPAAAAVTVGYLGFLLASLQAPPAGGEDAELAAFLERHQLTYGVAAYWQASTVTVDTGGRVRVRAVNLWLPAPGPYVWEAHDSWYDPGVAGNDARFVLRDTADRRSVERRVIERSFGQPSEEYHVGRYEVLVWNRNLLKDLANNQ